MTPEVVLHNNPRDIVICGAIDLPGELTNSKFFRVPFARYFSIQLPELKSRHFLKTHFEKKYQKNHIFQQFYYLRIPHIVTLKKKVNRFFFFLH